ncbi:MAG: hypothetical protein ABIA63_13620 [bacterium]
MENKTGNEKCLNIMLNGIIYQGSVCTSGLSYSEIGYSAFKIIVAKKIRRLRKTI